jgi:hypothetical protein
MITATTGILLSNVTIGLKKCLNLSNLKARSEKTKAKIKVKIVTIKISKKVLNIIKYVSPLANSSHIVLKTKLIFGKTISLSTIILPINQTKIINNIPKE